MLPTALHALAAGATGAVLSLMIELSGIWMPDMPGAVIILSGALSGAISIGWSLRAPRQPPQG